jgi:hypothetical protein
VLSGLGLPLICEKVNLLRSVRRRSNLCGLGATLLLCACSGDTFTSATTGTPDSSKGDGGQASGGVGAGGAQASSGGARASGGTRGSGGTVGIEAGAGAPSAGGAQGSEAGVVEASAPSTWCYGKDGLFCEDFDRYTHIDDVLNAPGYTYSVVGGQFSFVTDGSVPSKPNALHVVSTATSGVKTLLARTLPAFSAPANRVRLEFTLRIDKAENVGYLAGAAFAAILNGREVTDGAVAIAVGTTILNATVLELGYVEPTTDAGTRFNSDNAQGPFPPLNQWIGRYAIDIQYSGTSSARTGCARLLAGGVNQLSKCLALPASLSNPSQITIVLGIYSAGLGNNSGTVEVQFDNVLVTAS